MIPIIFGWPGKVKRLSIKEGTTIGELLAAEDVRSDPYEIWAGGQKREKEYVLQTNDVVLLLTPIRGERTIKRNGVWRIHKNDPDTNWPSDFHGHNQDAPEVLDLHTGNIYDTRTRAFVRKLSGRDLRFILEHLQGLR